MAIEGQEIARIGVSGGRRAFGLIVLGLLALALLWLGLRPEVTVLGMRLLMIVLGLLVGWAVLAMRSATRTELVLTTAGLQEADGFMIAPMDQIAGVDRGTFAFKPSNGFLLKLTQGGPRRFRPGMYWRIGRRVGVGGVLRASETKNIADQLSVILAGRAAAD